MVSRIVWSPRALADLRLIADYIGKSSPMTAERFCLRMIEHAESLRTFPLNGRLVPEKQRESLSELIFAPYRIAYEIREAGALVEILTIWHSARGPIELQP